jgi:phage baseplate assembly protein V
MSSLDTIAKATAGLKNKMQLMIGRCVLKAAKADGLLGMQIDGLEDETIDGAERIENYGLAGHPPGGAEGVMASAGGSRDHVLIVAMEHRGHRPTLEQGEVKMYSMFKQFIHLDKDGNIHIEAPENMTIKCKNLKITAPDKTEIEGDLNVNGNADVSGDVTDKTSSLQRVREQFNQHRHAGGPTPDQSM